MDFHFLIVDGIPCVLANNAEGYIPIRFEANTTIYIRGRKLEKQRGGAKRAVSMCVPSSSNRHQDLKQSTIQELVSSPFDSTHTLPPESFM